MNLGRSDMSIIEFKNLLVKKCCFLSVIYVIFLFYLKSEIPTPKYKSLKRTLTEDTHQCHKIIGYHQGYTQCKSYYVFTVRACACVPLFTWLHACMSVCLCVWMWFLFLYLLPSCHIRMPNYEMVHKGNIRYFLSDLLFLKHDYLHRL